MDSVAIIHFTADCSGNAAILAWLSVVLMVLVANLIWYFFVRPVVIILPLSQFAVYFVHLKWIVCPAMAIYFYSTGQEIGQAVSCENHPPISNAPAVMTR
jgi:hypothetical protein